MVDSGNGSVGDAQDIYSEVVGDGVRNKEKNKKNTVFMLAVLTLLKEIVQKIINNEAVRAEMLKKLEAAIGEAHAAESSKAFWDKLGQGVLAEVERQLKTLNDKTAEKLSAKVEVLQQQLDHLFQRAHAVSALTARFEADYPAIINSIADINTDLARIEDALEDPITAPEELITLSEQIADIRKQYAEVQGKFDNWLKEFKAASHQLNAAAAAVGATVTEITASAVTPAIAPAAVAPSAASVVMSAPSLDPVVTVAPAAKKPSFIVDDSTQQLLASLGLPAASFVSPQQKLDTIERELGALGLRIGAAEKTIVSQARQYPGLEIRNNNPDGLAFSPFIFLKNPSVAAGKPRPSFGRTLRDEEEEKLAALFRPLGLTRQ